MSFDLADRGQPLRARAEVCVIGSGGGGAVAAARLAEAGRDVIVLEQGRHWTAVDFTQREEEMLPRLFEDAGFRQTADGAITVLQGRNVGGSTVHNLCYAFAPPEPVVRLWREQHGLEALDPAALAASVARVEQGLGVRPIREDELNPLNRAVRAGCEKLGWSGFVARHNRRGCIGAGYCLLGCSYDAKQSMLITYVPRAEAAGARIYASARADRLECDVHGRVRRVHGHAVDAHGRALAPFEIEARAVVLAAGAINSPVLLRESGLGGPAAGEFLHLHPSVIAYGLFDEPLRAWRGIPQSYYVDEFIDLERDPTRGTILMPISGFPVTSAVQLPGFGREHAALMRELPRAGGLLALLHDRSRGQVRVGAGGRPEIRYRLRRDEQRALARGLRHCAEALFAGGAREVVIPYLREPLRLAAGADLAAIERRGVREGEIPIASTHPQSTCRMGTHPHTSVVDAFGRVHGAAGVYVADMSVFPTSLGAPPQITTAALADRTAEHLIARWPEV